MMPQTLNVKFKKIRLHYVEITSLCQTVTCYEQLNPLSNFKDIQYLSLSQNIVKQAKFHVSQCSESHTLLKAMKDILPVILRFSSDLDKYVTRDIQNIIE